MRSEAHRQIAELVAAHGPGWVERACKVSEGTARKWVTAGTMPQQRIRIQVFEALGVPVDAWEIVALDRRALVAKAAKDTAKAPPPPPPSPVAPPPPVVQGEPDPRADAAAVLHKLREHLNTADSDSAPKIANAITAAARLLARLSGQLEISESQIVRSLPWRKAMGLLEEALAPYPQAARAVADAIEGFGQ